MNLKLIKEKEEILHKKLESVEKVTPEIKELVLEMKETMKTNDGVGLAASQVGKDLRIFVIDEKLAEMNEVSSVYINPEITDRSKDMGYLEEGCLSIPEYFKEVARSKKIRIKALDENGKKFKFKATGFLARVLQHEYDHLNGILIKDKK